MQTDKEPTIQKQKLLTKKPLYDPLKLLRKNEKATVFGTYPVEERSKPLCFYSYGIQI